MTPFPESRQRLHEYVLVFGTVYQEPKFKTRQNITWKNFRSVFVSVIAWYLNILLITCFKALSLSRYNKSQLISRGLSIIIVLYLATNTHVECSKNSLLYAKCIHSFLPEVDILTTMQVAIRHIQLDLEVKYLSYNYFEQFRTVMYRIA